MGIISLIIEGSLDENSMPLSLYKHINTESRQISFRKDSFQGMF
jgi:hypothetical protein